MPETARRGLGDTRTPFVGTLLANALNIVLEYLFLFVLGWGVRGAALAVGLSQVGWTVAVMSAWGLSCAQGGAWHMDCGNWEGSVCMP